MMEAQLTYRQYAWKQFKKNKPALISFYVFLILVLVAVLSPFLANNQPLYMKYEGESFYPVFATILNESATETVVNKETGDTIHFRYKDIDWRREDLEKVVWPIIAYSPGFQDKFNRDYAHPNLKQRFLNQKGEIVDLENKLRHYLGTDKLGRDIASGLIHGTRISLLVGLVSMGIAVLIGLLLGAAAGLYGDHSIRLTRGQFWFGWIGVFLGYFYGFYVRTQSITEAFQESAIIGSLQVLFGVLIWVFFVFGFSQLGKLLSFGSFLGKKVSLPLDSYVNRLIEILNSLPILILIISISSIASGGSLWLLMIIIGVTGWTGVARLIRAEMLRVKSLEYIQAATVLGFPSWRIIIKHAIPNGLAPIFVAFAFGVASAILTESALSFLGIGVPADIVTWGSLLSLGRSEFEAWWLVIYPGLAIFITITVFNLLGEGLRDALDPKYRK